MSERDPSKPISQTPYIRRARVSDVADIARVHVTTWQVCYRGIMPDEFLDRLSAEPRAAMWRKVLSSSGHMLIVCRVDRRTVGFAAYGPTRDGDEDPAAVGEIYAIYVLPDYWRTGCGHLLWQRVAKELISARFREVTLWVIEANIRAREFYQREGFVIDPVAEKQAHVAGTKLPEVRYWKTLSR